jgi:hypothetical protein
MLHYIILQCKFLYHIILAVESNESVFWFSLTLRPQILLKHAFAYMRCPTNKGREQFLCFVWLCMKEDVSENKVIN